MPWKLLNNGATRLHGERAHRFIERRESTKLLRLFREASSPVFETPWKYNERPDEAFILALFRTKWSLCRETKPRRCHNRWDQKVGVKRLRFNSILNYSVLLSEDTYCFWSRNENTVFHDRHIFLRLGSRLEKEFTDLWFVFLVIWRLKSLYLS